MNPVLLTVGLLLVIILSAVLSTASHHWEPSLTTYLAMFGLPLVAGCAAGYLTALVLRLATRAGTTKG
jgi:hypothetical protein